MLMLLAFYNNSNAQANNTLSNLTSPTAVNQSLLPGTAHSKNLGNSTNQWQYLYLYGRIYLNGTLTMHAHGQDNFFAGGYAGNTSFTGIENTGIGKYALYHLTSADDNTAIGNQALYSNTSGYENTATGAGALLYNTTGYRNTATGVLSLYSNTKGYYNTATGREALYYNETGLYNTATGNEALRENVSGSYNTGVGYRAFPFSTGNGNTAVGAMTLANTSDGDSNNSILGYLADIKSFPPTTNATAIGYYTIVDASNKVRIGNTSVTSIGGQVGWSVFSDGRYKRDIKENIPGLVFINNLRPVSYTVDVKSLNDYFDKGRKFVSDSLHKIDRAYLDEAAATSGKVIYSGFVAQEVEQIAQKLNYNFSGVDKPQTKDGLYGLRYDNFVVPLVKAVQELSKKNDELGMMNDELKKQNDDLEQRVTRLETMMNVQSSTTNNKQQTTDISSASLEQNIPNPFGNSTTISYSLPQQYSSSKIIITDKSGKVLKEINVSGNEKGNVKIDASTLSSGAYQYSFYVDGKMIDTKQMIVLK